jgi:hypothetical protein
VPGRCDRGSYLCDAGHELRVTCRCIRTDLGWEPPQGFAELSDNHEIVRGFSRKRDVIAAAGKTVGPGNQERTLYRLGMGDDHRGATWHDSRADVVWLCAYGFHRSRQPGDAFQYFKELIRAGQIWPVPEDYEWLERDRAARLAESLPEAAQALLAAAQAAPNQEHRAVIGSGEVGIVVEIVETLEETYIAIVVSTMGDYTRLVVLLAAFYPDREFRDWGERSRLPTRALIAGEICLSILHE